ncbi:hypothetical protein M8C21_009945, partial [Ambrosia artemisiifolia]
MDMKEKHTTAEDWRKALKKVVPAVVVLRTTACRAFDTESTSSTQATGFVVDKRRGIILTNRHVVKPGPVTAEAMFVNREEIPVYPIYRDPVHDFGFFRYDPAAVKFLSCEEIPLAPEAASVGLDIRVVGNDSGEKISILPGTLARLDRDAPQYKRDGYNDFNTFYIQAASGTKGGSSGSPVIDWQGRAVALNAGGKTSNSSSAFYYPLERVVRALNIMQKGRYFCQHKWKAVTIPRGTIQATFVHKGFNETRRLGMQTETEQLVRDASPLSETGMLVVDSVVPGGPAYDHLEPGDVLVRINGEVTTQFLKMETLLDDSVGQNVELKFERGGTSLTAQLMVEDLHCITPNHFLEVSDGVIHPLSYQQARNFRFQCGLVYVSEPGCMLHKAGVPRHAIIKRLADEDVSNLENFINVLSRLSKGARVPLEYINYKDRHTRKSVLVTVDRHEWYASPQIYTRDDTLGIWIGKPALPSSSQLISSGIKKVANGIASMDTSSSEHVQEESYNGTIKSRVGEEEASADGTVIADVEDSTSPGDIVMSDEYDTSADSASDVMLSFAAFPIEIPGEVVFLHPVHNYTIIAYDPSAIGPAGSSLVRAAQLLPEPALRRGESVYLVGLSQHLQATSRKSLVTDPYATLMINSADSPEVIELDNGVLTDEDGRVKALWGSFPSQIQYGENYSEEARNFGLSNNWIQALVKKDPVRRQVLRVKGCLAGSKAENLLEQGDMVLAINKKPVTCFSDVEDACHALDVCDDMDAKLELTIFRQGHEMEVQVGIDIRDGKGTTHVISWCGCLVQDPHPAVRALGFLPQEGHGGPPGVLCIDTEIEDREFVRIRTVDLNGKPRVLTLKQDLHYWPTWEL